MTWGAEHGSLWGGAEDFVDHLKIVLARLLAQLRKRGELNTETMARFIAERYQAIEHDIHDTRWFRYINGAQGAQLDAIGDTLGQRRDGFDDYDYRAILKTRYATLFSRRSSDVVIGVLNVLTSGSSGVTFEHDNDWPACIVITVYGLDNDRSQHWNNLIRGPKPEGVRMVNTFVEDPDQCLDLDDATQGLDDPAIGLAHSYDATQAVGGAGFGGAP